MAFRLAYLMFSRVLSWLALLARISGGLACSGPEPPGTRREHEIGGPHSSHASTPATDHSVAGLTGVGITAMSVEPGAFRTDFSGRSLTQSADAIADYAGSLRSALVTASSAAFVAEY